ncbi:MAG TPA: penicillin-binding protein 1B [Pseudomonadales bacterium]
MSTRHRPAVTTIGKILITLLALALAVLAYLDAWIVERFNGQKWALPATVYARPLELYSGQAISADAIINELQASGYSNKPGGPPGSFYHDGNRLLIHSRPFTFWDGPQLPTRLALTFNHQQLASLTGNGKALTSARLEPLEIGKIHPAKREDRLLVTLDETPPALVNALLATEDRHFFEHHGIAVKSIARAMLANLRAGRVVEGGSTLTQQLVKNLFLHDQRRYTRKLLEALMAVILELRADKQQILEAYINEVYVAQDGQRAIHGFGLASRHLFDKPLQSLSSAECALLVGMMKGPSYYNPLKHPQRARQRRDLVLDLMAQQGMISSAEANAGKQSPLGVRSQSDIDRQHYPAYLDLVRRQLRRDYSPRQLDSEGLRIFTNLDPQWQWHSQRMLQRHLADLGKRHPASEGMDGAVVVIDHSTGDVLAIVGGRSPRFAGFNRALDARRPVGSLIKPAVYLAALENGYSLASLVSDAPLTVRIDQQDWQPQNFDRQHHGEVPLYRALANSYNVATVRLGLTLGLDTVGDTLQRLGISPATPLLPAMLLGALEQTPLDVAQMYGTIAARGFYTPLKSIREITDHHGQPLRRYPLQLDQRITPAHQYLLDIGLQAVMQEGTGKSVRARFAEQQRLAGKTGTSSDQRDSWFAGYDDGRLAVVWLGHDDNRSLPLTGSSGALPLWADIMQLSRPPAARKGMVPDAVQYLWVDANTGKLSGERCENAVYLPFLNGTEPTDLAQCNVTRNPIRHWFKKWLSLFD